MKSAIRFLVCVLTTGLLLGCKSASIKITKTRDFDFRNLEREGLAIAGITALGGGEYAVADTVSLRLEEQLHNVATNMRVIELPTIRSRMGAQDHLALSKHVSDREMIPESLWRFFEANPDLPQYALWMNLVTDRSNTSVHESKDITYRTETDSEGNTEQVVDTVTYVTTTRATRFVAMTFSIHDTTSGRRVWHAQTSRSDGNSISAASSFNHPRPLHTRPPGAFETLEPIFKETAQRLAKL